MVEWPNFLRALLPLEDSSKLLAYSVMLCFYANVYRWPAVPILYELLRFDLTGAGTFSPYLFFAIFTL
jgi:hypothetical protein